MDLLCRGRWRTNWTPNRQASEEGAIVYLTTQIATMPPGSDDGWSVVQRACDVSVSDGAMFVALRNLRSGNSTENWEDSPRKSGLTPESYPIAWSWLQGSAGHTEDARRTLHATNPANDTDRAVYEVARHDVQASALLRIDPALNRNRSTGQASVRLERGCSRVWRDLGHIVERRRGLPDRPLH